MLNEAYPWFKDLGREKTEDLLNIIYKPEITPSPLFNYECVVHKEPFGFKFQLKSGCSEPKGEPLLYIQHKEVEGDVMAWS